MALITLIVGFIAGFISNILAMKISFKQRTIDNKIKVYDSLICKWIEMRNHLYHFGNIAERNEHKWLEFDKIYGSSQVFIAEVFLISDDQNLAENINDFNEKLYRQNWFDFSLDQVGSLLDELKIEGLTLINRMKNDIHESTRFNFNDIIHILGFCDKNKQR